jgi:hypothetical protein
MTLRQSPIFTVVTAVAAAAVVAVAPAARAHHSAAAYDTKQTVSLDAVVTRYEWKNPHVYIWLAAPNAGGEMVEWEVEGQPPAILRRMGWSQETMRVGDAVQATGNPGRNAERKTLLLVSMKRADATLYDGASMLSALTTSAPAPAASTNGLAGVWVTLLDMGSMQAFLNPARRVPLTEAGTAAQAAFDDATMNPGIKCIPTPAPMFMFAPDVKRVTLGEGSIRIEGEFAAAERVIRLVDAEGEGAARPATPSLHGHSVGRWDGATLVVETSDFAPHGTGIGFSLPSSPKKHLTERLTLDPDGKGLSYAYELSDSEMLTAPITGGNRWVYRPDLEFAALACDPENAQRSVQ